MRNSNLIGVWHAPEFVNSEIRKFVNSTCHLLYEGNSQRGEARMPRISLIESDAAGPEVKQIYETTLKGKPANVHKAMAHRPEVLKSFPPFYASVGRSIDKKLYEEIYIRVSWLNGCNY